MSEMDVGRLFGNVLGSSIPLVVGWGIASYLRKRRKVSKLPRLPVILGGILSFLMLASSLGQHLLRQQKLETVQVQRTEQSAEGISEEDIDSEYMDEIGLLFEKELESAQPGSNIGFSSSVVEQGGKKLGVIRISDASSIPVVLVIGISNGKLVRIMCGVGVGNVDVNSTECAAALRKDFGVDLDG